MHYYVHRKHIFSKNRAEEDGKLTTFDSEIPVFKGELILTNLDNESIVETDSRFNNYVRVNVVGRKCRKKQPNPFEEQYAKQLLEFQLDSNLEDE